MRLFSAFWKDDFGVLLSAEAVVVGTVAVVGLTAGLSVVSEAVNEELKDVAFAIRSLDQSYSIPAMEGCGARTAGSKFQQEPVEKSLKELCDVIRAAEKDEKVHAERQEQKLRAAREAQEKREEDARRAEEKERQARKKKSRDEEDDDDRDDDDRKPRRNEDKI
jgi:hypothetical protein